MSLPRRGHLRHRQHSEPGLDQHRRVRRLSDGGPGPTVSDHPRPRPQVHPAAAPHGVDHHALLHHPGHHLPHRHLRPAGDVTLAPRGHTIRPLDRLRRDGPVLHGRPHLPHRLLHQRGGGAALQAPQQHGGGLLLRPLHPLHLLHHRGAAVRREGLFTRLTSWTSREWIGFYFWDAHKHERLRLLTG